MTDGRDTPPRSIDEYLPALERRFDGRATIATVSGRYYAMDRDRRWDRTALAYEALVRGVGLAAATPREAIEAAYARDESDEFIRPTVVGDRVLWQASQDEGTVERVEPSRNLFYRQDEIRTKSFAANLDHVLILIAALAPRALRVWARKQTARARAVAAQDGGNVEDAVASQKPDAEEAGAEDDRPEPEPTATEPDDTPDPGPEGAEPEDEEPRTTDTGEKTSGAHADGDDTHRETGGTNT